MKSEYKLCEPFYIDNGELNGLKLRDAFTLGVEWQMVHAQMDTGKGFERSIHKANVYRICAMCERRGRDFAIEPLDKECVQLIVKAM